MLVEVNVKPPLDKVMGGKQVSVEIADGASVETLLAHLKQHYPGFEEQLEAGGDEYGTAFNFFINRKALRRGEAATAHLKDGDRVHILVPIVGGCR